MSSNQADQLLDEPVKRSRGRPRAYDRAEVLAKATEVFLSVGLEGATIDALSTATGLSRPSLKLAFGGRVDILCAAIDHHRVMVSREMMIELADQSLETAFTAALNRLIAMFVNGSIAGGCLITVTVPLRGKYRKLDSTIAAARQDLHEAFKNRLMAAPGSGDQRKAMDTACAMIAITYWLAQEARAGRPQVELESVAGRLVKMVLSGF